MTWEIGFIIFLLVAALISFALEKISADLTALAVFAALLVSGILSPEEAFTVFTNPAPIAVGAMFILSAALEKSGAIDLVSMLLRRLARFGYGPFLLVMCLTAAVVSAFINNTLVVVIFLPVVMTMAREIGVAPSKLLIPLSFASIFGGASTLIGTSTNLLVSGVARDYGEPAIGMFELVGIGVPLLIVGIGYLYFFGRRYLPARDTLTSILTEDERREYIIEAFVRESSPLAGKSLEETGILKEKGMRVISIVRGGSVLQTELGKVVLQPGDRLELASRPSGVARARGLEGIDLAVEAESGLEPIAAREGMIVEGVIGPNSFLLGKSLAEAKFRQRYRMIALGIHRRGKRARGELSKIRLEFGDTLLLLGGESAIDDLRGGEDILIIDRPYVPAEVRRLKLSFVAAVIVAAMAASAVGLAPIEIGAVVGCVILFLSGILKPRDGYRAVQWNIMFLIFGMLALGKAMEQTGTAEFFARGIVAGSARWFPEAFQPVLMLAAIYLLTSVLTEILSNNASAVLSATLAIGLARLLDVDPRPFIVAVAMGASASFATPIGYQTNTYVYGVGGYRFLDFVKFGAPLKLLFFLVSVVLIPLLWAF